MSGSAAAVLPRIELDHLVVACRSLAAGRAWCEATFGVAPEAGGRHALMGTHNLLLAVASPRFPRAYLELIAIDPDAPAPPRRRWFDLDDAALQAALAEPRLVRWVARTTDIETARAVLSSDGFDPGTVVAAERMTPRGLLRWRITLPVEGGRRAAGAAPLLIEWGDVHPTDSLPPSGVVLEALRISGVPSPLAALFESVAWTADSAAPLQALLGSPRGAVTLRAPPQPAA